MENRPLGTVRNLRFFSAFVTKLRKLILGNSFFFSGGHEAKFGTPYPLRV
jgi:hypothetical protein